MDLRAFKSYARGGTKSGENARRFLISLAVVTGCIHDDHSANQIGDCDPALLKGPVHTAFDVPPAQRGIKRAGKIVSEEYEKIPVWSRRPGAARVFFLIDMRGEVADAKIDVTSGMPAIDSAAVRVAKAFDFSPAFAGARPVCVWLSLPIVFRDG